MNWAKKVLWFVFGFVVAGSLMLISTSRAVEPQGYLERLTALEQRMAAVEARFKQMDKDAKEAEKEYRNQQRQLRTGDKPE